jgi:hypothetical protein
MKALHHRKMAALFLVEMNDTSNLGCIDSLREVSEIGNCSQGRLDQSFHEEDEIR